jgi:hypothetical protein
MASLISDVEFDPDSLAIEYPFLEIEDTDLSVIRHNPNFFGGYFVPKSQAGDRRQIAQMEMFAHHVTAIAPMTIVALHRFRGSSIVSSFYAAIQTMGVLNRSDLDWETGQVLRNWRVIKPYVVFIIDHLGLSELEQTLVNGLLVYEDQRVNFAATDSSSSHETDYAFLCATDIPEALIRLASEGPLDSALLRATTIVFRRHRSGVYQCFAGLSESRARTMATG